LFYGPVEFEVHETPWCRKHAGKVFGLLPFLFVFKGYTNVIIISQGKKYFWKKTRDPLPK
jgi:hypothetical protein